MTAEPGWLTIDCEGEHRVVRLDLAVTTIGRNEGNVIDLPDRKLSRFHCEVEKKEDSYVLRDLGSRNGTKINGIRIAAPVTLADGDKVEIGATVIVFKVTRPPEASQRDVAIPIPMVLAGKVSGSRPTRALELSGVTPDEPFDPRPTAFLQRKQETERAPAATLLTRAARAVELVAEVATPEQVIARLVDQALELQPAKQALLILPPTEPGSRHQVAAQRPVISGGEAPARFSSVLVEDVLRKAKSAAIDDLKADQRYAQDVSVLGLGLKAAIAIPLRGAGRARGVLYLDDPQAADAEKREETLSALSVLADAVGLALEGARVRSLGGGADPRSHAAAARLNRITAQALPASTADLSVRLVPGRSAFFEIDEAGKPTGPGGRRELVMLLAHAPGDDTGRLEASTKTAFRALAKGSTRADALLIAIEEALGTELAGRTLACAVLRLDTASCELRVATAALGPVFQRKPMGEVLSASGVGPALGSGAAASGVVERVIAWDPGDVVLVTAPRSATFGAAPWLTGTVGLGASAVLERLFADAAIAPPSPDNLAGAVSLERAKLGSR